MQTKLCPHCHKRKGLDKFGERKIGKKTYLQSHCIECRGVKNPHAKKYTIQKKTSKKDQRKTRTNRKQLQKSRKTRKPVSRSTSKAQLEKKAAKLEKMIAEIEAKMSAQ